MADELDSRRSGARSKLRVLLTGLLVVVVVVAAAYTLLESVFGVGLLHRPFDREAWAAEGRPETDRERIREGMVRNLIKRRLALGMSRAEVERLLGPPDADPTLAAREEGDWIYELGATFTERMHFIWWSLTDESGEDVSDFEEVSSILKMRALMIGFDADGRVDRFELVEV